MFGCGRARQIYCRKLGFVIYGDFKLQPKFTENFFNISSNHFYIYVAISFLGFFSYLRDNKFKLIVIYLFFLSVILELLQLPIPERSFQISDLIGNVLGVSVIYIFILIIKITTEFTSNLKNFLKKYIDYLTG